MFSLVKRNLMLYLRNRSGVFFSLFGAMISFVLYLVFLKQSIKSGWAGLPDASQLLDNWLIAGTLTITGITTSLTALSQMVKDEEQKIDLDLRLTDIGPVAVRSSYLIAAATIAFLMQVIVYLVMATYFGFTDSLAFSWTILPELLLIMVLSALLATAVNAIIVGMIHSVDSLSKLASLIGTASGFLVGTYVPLGTLPDMAQFVMKLTPGTYLAALYRQTLMTPKLTDVFAKAPAQLTDFEKMMGVKIEWTALLSHGATYWLVIVLLVITAGILTIQSLKKRRFA
ncbi:ABC transporter permease [Fructobacillus sp. M1-13]|uniref:ABC transporter permease n=1 Tax=Fructobacillus papyriferae TaxID=2713171 RepID=A0ABS5QQT7_9LACO|nr:ABC transporter permease [Fructobacillus papyriferae]MBS9335560.1 ABC transporter permease [Fructobacillus papyriferae]MCD2159350.1 ABC transporter permease [Fructobacillus papyriferae]